MERLHLYWSAGILPAMVAFKNRRFGSAEAGKMPALR
jgi:hypothetical protein